MRDEDYPGRQWRHEAQRFREAMLAALDELGVPGPGYPAPVANAVGILRHALGFDGSEGGA